MWCFFFALFLSSDTWKPSLKWIRLFTWRVFFLIIVFHLLFRVWIFFRLFVQAEEDEITPILIITKYSINVCSSLCSFQQMCCLLFVRSTTLSYFIPFIFFSFSTSLFLTLSLSHSVSPPVLCSNFLLCLFVLVVCHLWRARNLNHFSDIAKCHRRVNMRKYSFRNKPKWEC